jgi:hypothetical protein
MQDQFYEGAGGRMGPWRMAENCHCRPWNILNIYPNNRKSNEFKKSAFEPQNVEQGISNRRSETSTADTSKFEIPCSTFCGSNIFI